MDKELEFVNQSLDFYTKEDREKVLGQNALKNLEIPRMKAS